jgi:hypothetical protein
MATLLLGAAGAALGGSIGGSILGVSAATIGGMVGSTAGAVVDSWIVSSLAPSQRVEGQRLDSLRITSSAEGAVIPRLWGRMRIGGNLIWATDFREETETTRQRTGGGKGGGGGRVETKEYLYSAAHNVRLQPNAHFEKAALRGLRGGLLRSDLLNDIWVTTLVAVEADRGQGRTNGLPSALQP